MPGIFISYRREDTLASAGRLYDWLKQRFGPENTFMDVDTIEPGEDFVEAIERKVGICDALVALIGKDWLDCKDEAGARRLDDENDFVRIEILAALNRNVRVIPLVVEGARMPRLQDLPAPLMPLARRQALEVSHTRFHQDMDRLIKALEKVLASAEEKRQREIETLAREKAETERAQAEKAEQERLVREQAETAKRTEQERLAREKAEAAKRAEEERLARERAEAAKRAEEERLAREKAEAAQRAEEERLAREQAEAIKLAEQKRLAREKAARVAESAMSTPVRPAVVKSAPAPEPGEVRINPIDGEPYVWIPPGKFQMGASPGDKECSDDEKPAHPVTLTKGFWIGQTPVTVGAYRKFAEATNVKVPRKAFFFEQTESYHPVVDVAWEEAKAYCQWAGGCLPTEAEWEYAARAGNTAARYGELEAIAWYNASFGGTKVRTKQPNAWGLYDMLGNVWEWCSDWYGSYQAGEQIDPQGAASGESRVRRGGSWVDVPRGVRVSGRLGSPPEFRGSAVGFRCVREVIP